MCLILFAIASHSRFPLIVAANRDERYARPTRPLGWWPEAPQLLAGQDMEAGGTWLGLTRGGRFAAITNVREGVQREEWQRSRGELTRDFLLGDASAADFAMQAYARRHDYAGFNLLIGDCDGVHYFSNRGEAPRRLAAGVYGLSNDNLDSAWPKVINGKLALADVLKNSHPTSQELLHLLADTQSPSDAELPNTGVGIVLERVLASAFIATDLYGTRASTVLLVDRSGNADIVEQNFSSGGAVAQRLEFRVTLDRHFTGY